MELRGVGVLPWFKGRERLSLVTAVSSVCSHLVPKGFSIKGCTGDEGSMLNEFITSSRTGPHSLY